MLKRLRENKSSQGTLLITPTLIFMVGLLIIPLFLTLIISFGKRSAEGNVIYTFGLHNYIRIGLEKKTRVINPREKKIIAHHEIGHALTAELLPHGDPVRKVSIIPRGIAALGYTQQLPTEDRYLMTRTELENRLCVLLGGRVAEEIIFEDVSTGAQDDLQKATDTARCMVTEYGMSKRLGLRTFEKERRGLFLDTPWSTKKDYSEKKAADIDKEVEEILEQAHRRVRELLSAQRPLLEHLASVLLEKEILEGEELRRLIQTALKGDGVDKGATIH